MKPRSKKVKFDASWLALLPADKRGDYRFMYEVARVVKRRGIKRGDLAAVSELIHSLNAKPRCS
ncbi:hypothetical protein [Endozoicomonas atrinae]|uniref:hypothetical protein n=1 Tax=Endozoicomonas atrinae TaxID=1333660 RepID=UPI0008246514|nr:hypothetical protein [Endozoicomonas atrinae]